MQIQTEGIVIKETNAGENDKYITILTTDNGTIEAFVKGARRKGSRLSAPTSLFCYSSFVLFYNKYKYSVDQADINNLFYDIRNDMLRLSCASYFCQILGEVKPDNDNCKVALRLMLNSMHLLANTKKDVRIIKAVFELRCMTLSGFSPNLVACNICSKETNKMRFYIDDGILICDNCANHLKDDVHYSTGYAELTKGVLAAMRHIVYSEPEKVFSFTLDDENIKLLGEICEAYLIWQTERNYKTLDFYKSIAE